MPPSNAPSFAVPPSLTVVLQAAGYHPTLLVQRSDGGVLTPEDSERVRALSEAYGEGHEHVTNRELWEGLTAVRAGTFGSKATGTEG